jgi:hypothetical protein
MNMLILTGEDKFRASSSLEIFSALLPSLILLLRSRQNLLAVQPPTLSYELPNSFVRVTMFIR